jgi:hypothetical protein
MMIKVLHKKLCWKPFQVIQFSQNLNHFFLFNFVFVLSLKEKINEIAFCLVNGCRGI